MIAQIYHPAPDLAVEYAYLLPSFGTSPELADWARQYAVSEAARCQWDARFLAQRAKRILNIGGAPFLFETMLRREKPDIDITTIDLEPNRFPGVEATLGLRLIQGDIESEDWRVDGEFDCVVFTEVFEHLRIDLLGTMTRIRNIMGRDTIFYLSTPNGSSLWAWTKRLLKGRTGPPPVPEWAKLQRIRHMGHVREYSLIEVREVLEACGFVVDSVIYRNRNDGRWPLRDLLLPVWPALSSEIVVIARRAGNGSEASADVEHTRL